MYRGGIPPSSLEVRDTPDHTIPKLTWLQVLIQGPGHAHRIKPANGRHNSNIAPDNAQPSVIAPVDRPSPRPLVQTPNNEQSAHINNWQPKCTEEEQADNFSRQTSPGTDNTSYPSDGKEEYSASGDKRDSAGSHVSKSEYHTVALKNLPERATHRDIAEAVRGGALVDIFLRTRDRTASVTFVDAKAANEYLMYAKRRNVYVLGKPVLIPCHTALPDVC